MWAASKDRSFPSLSTISQQFFPPLSHSEQDREPFCYNESPGTRHIWPHHHLQQKTYGRKKSDTDWHREANRNEYSCAYEAEKHKDIYSDVFYFNKPSYISINPLHAANMIQTWVWKSILMSVIYNHLLIISVNSHLVFSAALLTFSAPGMLCKYPSFCCKGGMQSQGTFGQRKRYGTCPVLWKKPGFCKQKSRV